MTTDMSPAAELDHLEGVLSILGEPKRWTRGADARAFPRRSVLPQSDEAESWCLWGAIVRVWWDSKPGLSLSTSLNADVFTLNDFRGYEAVLDALCARIDELRESQGVEA